MNNTRLMNAVVSLLLVLCLAVSMFQLADHAFADDGEGEAYTVTYAVDGEAVLDIAKSVSNDLLLPEYTLEDGYEFCYADADVKVGDHEAGYKFSEPEFYDITGADIGENTSFTLHFICSDGDSIEVSAKEAEPAIGGSIAMPKLAALSTSSFPSVEYNKYQNLPANYVKILKSLNMEEAEVVNTMPGVKLYHGYPGGNATKKVYFFAYHGDVDYGKSNRSAKSDAKTEKKSLSGKLQLTWKNKATLSNGEKADVRITVDNIYWKIGAKKSSKISSGADVYLPIIGNGVDGRACMMVSTPRTAYTTNSYSDSYVTGATCQARRRVTIQILKDGAPLDKGEFPSMLVGFKDLDVQDHSVASGSSMTALYNGRYAEGISLVSGWFSPVELANKTSSNKAMQTTVNTRELDDHLNIKGDGAKYKELEKATGLTEDLGTYYGGFVAACVPASSSFYWYGSSGTGGNYTNTIIAGHPTVSVRGKRTTVDSEGNVLNEDGGNLVRTTTGTKFVNDVSGNGEWVDKTYVMNSAVQYRFTPKEGYKLKSLKVDGKSIEKPASGGVYDFVKLNKNPLPDRNPKTGAILAASASSYYKIEVVYEKVKAPEFSVTKTADRKRMKIGDKSEINYTIEVDQPVSGAVAGAWSESDDLANGILDVIPDSVTTSVTGKGTGSAVLKDGKLKVSYATANNESGKLTVKYRATVNWSRLSELADAVTTDEKAKRSEVAEGIITNTIADASWSVTTHSDVELSKTVTGDLADKTKKFEYLVKLSKLHPGATYEVVTDAGSEMDSDDGTNYKADKNGNAEILIKIRDGGKAVIKELPYGAEYQITEEVSDHIASYKITLDGDKPVCAKAHDSNEKNFQRIATEMERIDAGDGNAHIAFTNSKNSITITGVRDEFRPYITGGAISALALLMIGGAMVLI